MKKAESLLNVMTRLSSSKGGMSSKALRSLYTGAIRTIFTWGSELWNGPHSKTNTSRMERMKYKALRKITVAYHGSNKAKLGYIAGVEPLQAKLDDLSTSWAARSLHSGDPTACTLVDSTPSTEHTSCHDGTGRRGFTTDSAISSAFYISPIPSPESRSYGNRDSLDSVSIIYLPLLDPKNQRSKEKEIWAGTIRGLVEQGWKVIYTDGTGKAQGAAGAMVHRSTEDAQIGEEKTRYLGKYATAADVEKAAIGLACAAEGSMNFILTDSQAALQGILNLSKGHPPRSSIKIEIKDNVIQKGETDTAIAWIRSHIGIPGNEQADRAANFASILGDISSSEDVVTEGGIRQISRAARGTFRHQSGFGKRRSDWHRHTITGYTWMRTNRGPQKSWLYHIGKTDDPRYPCGHGVQDGDHITFECPQLDTIRKDLLGPRKTWEELDDPNWRKDDGDDSHWDTIEAFCDNIFSVFS